MLGAGHAAGGRLASHSSTMWRGQPMEFAPSLRAWGNVPSARHRHSVRRLTPTRSSTSGTRNMASAQAFGDMSDPFTARTGEASRRGARSRRSVAWLAQTVEGSRAAPGAAAATVAEVGRHGQRHRSGGDACAATGAPCRRGGDRAIWFGGHGLPSYEAPRNARERSRTRPGRRRSSDAPGDGAPARPRWPGVVTETPSDSAEAQDAAQTPEDPRQQPTQPNSKKGGLDEGALSEVVGFGVEPRWLVAGCELGCGETIALGVEQAHGVL